MKKSFRILALVMALMTALGAASFASADMPTNYVGVTTVEDTDFFYQVPAPIMISCRARARLQREPKSLFTA